VVDSDNKGMSIISNEFLGLVFTEENLLTLPKIKPLEGEYLHTLSDVAISEAIIVKELRVMKGR